MAQPTKKEASTIEDFEDWLREGLEKYSKTSAKAKKPSARRSKPPSLLKEPKPLPQSQWTLQSVTLTTLQTLCACGARGEMPNPQLMLTRKCTSTGAQSFEAVPDAEAIKWLRVGVPLRQKFIQRKVQVCHHCASNFQSTCATGAKGDQK